MPYNYTGIPLLFIGGVLVVVGAACGPETRDVEFQDELAVVAGHAMEEES